jgi:hypothetical protein
MITGVVLCRKSTDLSWEGQEPSAVADEEDRSAGVEESAPLPLTETIAQAAEATPQEATMVEGTWSTPMEATLCSSRKLRF